MLWHLEPRDARKEKADLPNEVFPHGMMQSLLSAALVCFINTSFKMKGAKPLNI